jgi:phosphoglycerate-specific signal transduction histidine kinase
MNYKQFCKNIGYTDKGTRDWNNVKVRAAYVKAFRPFFTLTELGRQMGKTHATIIHYEKLKFPRDKFYESTLDIAEKLRGTIPVPQEDEDEVMVTSVLNYDYLLEQNAKLVIQVKKLEAKLATLKEFVNGI